MRCAGVGEGISGGVIFGLSVARRAACGDRGARPTLAANALVGFVLVCAGLVLIFLQVPATAPLPPDRVDSPVASILQPRYSFVVHPFPPVTILTDVESFVMQFLMILY